MLGPLLGVLAAAVVAWALWPADDIEPPPSIAAVAPVAAPIVETPPPPPAEEPAAAPPEPDEVVAAPVVSTEPARTPRTERPRPGPEEPEPEPEPEPVEPDPTPIEEPEPAVAELAPEPELIEEPEPELVAPDLTGIWRGTARGRRIELRIVSQDGSTLSGEVDFILGDTRRTSVIAGSVDAATGKLRLAERGGDHLVLSGLLTGDEIRGMYMKDGQNKELAWSARR